MCRTYEQEHRRQQPGMETATKQKVTTKSHRDDWCWRLAARDITSPVPGAARVVGSDLAGENRPTHPPPLQLRD